MPHRTALLAAFVLLLAAAVPTSAAAQGWTCESSALRLKLGPAPAEAPVTANAGQPTCRAAAAGGNPPASPLPVSGSLLSATTDIQPATGDPAAQTATAEGGLGELRIAGLPIPLARPDLSQLPGPTAVGPVTIDVRGAVEALVPASLDAELLDLRALRAEVTGRCVGGDPRLTGTSSVLGVSVLGVELPVDRAVSRTIGVADSTAIDPSNLSPAQLGLPGVVLDPLVQQFLDDLPSVEIPATVAQVRATPGRRFEAGGKLTQRALELSIAVAGQNVLEAVFGEATVGATAVNCGGVADLALECTSRPLVLIDVLRSKGRVRLLGAANRRYAGRRVAIRFMATGKVVARPRVRTSGLFRATAKLPRRALRATNRARYRAEIGRQRSLRLKLVRRMLISDTSVRGGRVTIAGRVVRPLASPVRSITVKRRVSCGRFRVVKRFKPRSDGSFRVTVGGPAGSQAAVYRMQTRVRKFATVPKTYPTFTLPRFVELGG
jgi:hypothetical protein